MTACLSIVGAIAVDTVFYRPASSLSSLLRDPVIAPLNSLLYNTQTSNLSEHGLHPHYQHLVVSLPLLLGPALALLPTVQAQPPRIPIISALSGILFLSIVPHQEPRFLVPIVPLILASIHLPGSAKHFRYWTSSWVIFNTLLGALMGTFHQGGVVPMQLHLGQQKGLSQNISQVIWWRTYSPPVWLHGHNTIQTIDIMGVPFPSLEECVGATLGPECSLGKRIGLVAPYSSIQLDEWINNTNGLKTEKMWHYARHINLDDLDIGEEGAWDTVGRVVGRRGLTFWTVTRVCRGDEEKRAALTGDW